MKKILKLIVFNLILVFILVIAFSPGFLNLRPYDESILRAGLSIMVGLASCVGFFYINYQLLQGKVYEIEEGHISQNDIMYALNQYKGNPVVGEYARTAIEQKNRFDLLLEQTDAAINQKFEPQSISWTRYHTAIETAREHVDHCFTDLATAMISFDYKTWGTRKTYKLDNIPDSLQEKQFALLEQDLKLMNDANVNTEKVIFALNSMKSELRTLTSNETSDTVEVIEQLASELQYYTS